MQGNQIELGLNAYLFLSSDPNSNTIMILAHGGREEGKQFTVPAGCTIHYHSNPGQPYRMLSGPIEDYNQLTISQESVFNKPAGTSALDMKLGKILDSHWDHWDAGVTERGYKGLSDKMQEVARNQSGTSYPHVIVVRNRSDALFYTTPYVWLSELVERILRCSQLRGGPFDIHVRACLSTDEAASRLRAGKQRFQTAQQ
jgi:hypothetical protein